MSIAPIIITLCFIYIPLVYIKLVTGIGFVPEVCFRLWRNTTSGSRILIPNLRFGKKCGKPMEWTRQPRTMLTCSHGLHPCLTRAHMRGKDSNLCARAWIWTMDLFDVNETSRHTRQGRLTSRSTHPFGARAWIWTMDLFDVNEALYP